VVGYCIRHDVNWGFIKGELLFELFQWKKLAKYCCAQHEHQVCKLFIKKDTTQDEIPLLYENTRHNLQIIFNAMFMQAQITHYS
jgi:hypothetical protein